MKTFEFTHIKEGIGSTHRVILETYTTSYKSKCHQLQAEHGWPNQRIGFINGIMYQERPSRGFCIQRTLSDDYSTNDLMVRNGNYVSIATQPAKETMHRHWIIEATD